jgi:hypothetical protein
LWLRNLEKAENARDHLTRLGIHGRLVDASRRSLEAGIDALSGNTTDAVAAFAEASGMLREHDMPLDLSLCLMDEVATLGLAEPAGRDAADEARQLLKDLGAVVLIDQLEKLVGRGAVPEPAEVEQTSATRETARAEVSVTE